MSRMKPNNIMWGLLLKDFGEKLARPTGFEPVALSSGG